MHLSKQIFLRYDITTKKNLVENINLRYENVILRRGGSGESLISNYSARLPSFLRQDERTCSPNIAFTTCLHLWNTNKNTNTNAFFLCFLLLKKLALLMYQVLFWATLILCLSWTFVIFELNILQTTWLGLEIKPAFARNEIMTFSRYFTRMIARQGEFLKALIVQIEIQQVWLFNPGDPEYKIACCKLTKTTSEM